MARIERVIILGPSHALKTRIVIEELWQLASLEGRALLLLCEGGSGQACDYCRDHGIPVATVRHPALNDDLELRTVANLKSDLLVSCGWPHKICTQALSMFDFAPVNCHGSLLPDYRGKRAYLHAWANMEEYYGATIHYMTGKFDDGNILAQARLKLYRSETLRQVHRRIAELTAAMLPHAVSMVEQNTPGRQPSGRARYFHQISRRQVKLYRIANRLAALFGCRKRLTPHRELTLISK